MVCPREKYRSPDGPSAAKMSSNTPCVSWVYSGALPKIPQNSPISECTIWPPISGSESISTTERPSRADSIAAVEPAIPAPTTQTSAVISCTGSAAGRVTASSRSSVSSCGMSGTLSPLTTVKQENACANGYKPDLLLSHYTMPLTCGFSN